MLSRGQYLYGWTINTLGYNPSSFQCLGTDMIFKIPVYVLKLFTVLNVTLVEFVSFVHALVFTCSQKRIFNLVTLAVPESVYSRNEPCALHYMSLVL